MAKIETGHYISSLLEDGRFAEQIRDELITIAFGADAIRGNNRFAQLSRKRFRKTGKFNTAIAGEMLDDMGIELAVVVTASRLELVRYNERQRYPYDSTGNRDGDLINGVFYGQMPAKRFRNRLIKGGVRLNRHHRNKISAMVLTERDTMKRIPPLQPGGHNG